MPEKPTVLEILIDQFEKFLVLQSRYESLESPKEIDYAFRVIKIAALIENEASSSKFEMPLSLQEAYVDSLKAFHNLTGWAPLEELDLQSLDPSAVKKIRKVRDQLG